MTEEQCRDLLLSTDIPWELEAEEVDKIIESINVEDGKITWDDFKAATVGEDGDHMEPVKMADVLFELRFERYIAENGICGIYSPRSWRLKLKGDTFGAGVFEEDEDLAEDEVFEDLVIDDDEEEDAVDDKKDKKDKKEGKDKKEKKDDKKDKKEKKEKKKK